MHERVQAAMTLLKQGRQGEAELALAAHLDLQPDDVESIEILAALKTNSNQWREAVALLRNSISQLPASAKLQRLLADVLGALGDMNGAEQAYGAALSIDPLCASAALGLAGVKRHRDSPQFLQELERSAATADLGSQEKSGFYFAAGKVADDMGDFQRAFQDYARANQLAGASNSGVDVAVLARRIRATFSKAYLRSMRKAKAGAADKSALFIVGMPRSGTTLLEQMLGRHPRVQGLGELQHLNLIGNSIGRSYKTHQQYPESVLLLDRVGATALGKRYLEKTGAMLSKASARYSLDKFPLNFLHLGLLSVILPNARVLHIERHPLDTCLSCYFQRFSLPGMDFTNSLESLAQTYREYRSTMDHWRKIIPGQILDISYEALLENPERSLRRAMAHCTLPWDDRCLRQGAEQNPVRTASYWQARQPLYQSSSGRWRNYEHQIGPLRESLADFLN